jgi:spermidine/putrescine transport system ATP-binding protein
MLEVSHVFKYYNNQLLLDDVSFQVGNEETICLLGPSGGGKSTLLRIIAGLEEMEKGWILWDGSDITNQPAHTRQFGLMFQDYALFPHMTVSQNAAFGLRMQQADADVIRRRTAEVLDLVNMSAFAERRVTDLSGGEQQRVALARALAPQPRLLMLDEPLGALDRALREQLNADLRLLLNRVDMPVIYVTHDQEEAFAIADRLLILHDGKIIQAGKPEEVYRRPVSLWLASFLGQKNQIRGKVAGSDPLRIRTDYGILECGSQCLGLHTGQEVTLVLPPSAAELRKAGTNTLPVSVADMLFRGDGYKIDFKLQDGQFLTFHFAQPLSIGQKVDLFIQPESILCFKEDQHGK